MNTPPEGSSRRFETRVGSARLVIAGAIILGTALALRSLTMPGYALDEDLTALAVHGIQQSGLPLLPSGILNDRGLAFSYLAWAAGIALGQTLNSYRLVSLVSGLTALIAVHRLATGLVTRQMAAYACVLLAIFPVHAAVSGWARFYSLATAAFAGALAWMLRRTATGAGRVWPLAAVGLTALTHELCLTLMALPVFAAIAGAGPETRRAWQAAAIVLLSFVGVEAALAGLHFVAPNQSLNPLVYQDAAIGAERIWAAAPLAPVALARVPALVLCGVLGGAIAFAIGRRAPLVAVLCATCALLFQLGIMGLVIAVAILLRPDKAGLYAKCVASFSAMTIAFWSLHTWAVSSAALNVELVTSLIKYSLVYPTDALTFFSLALPITTSLVGIAAASSLTYPSDDVDRRVRLLTALFITGVTSVSVLRLPSNSRYFIVFWPIVVVLALRGAVVVARLAAASVKMRRMQSVCVAGLLVATALEQHAFGAAHPVINTTGNRAAGIVARVPSDEWPAVLSAIPPTAEIVTNDEIAAVYHIGRVDDWVSFNQQDLQQYTVFTPTGARGEYAGARVVSSEAALTNLLSRERERPIAVVLFEAGRFEYRLYADLVASALQNHPGVTVRVANGIAVFVLPATSGAP